VHGRVCAGPFPKKRVYRLEFYERAGRALPPPPAFSAVSPGRASRSRSRVVAPRRHAGRGWQLLN